MGGSVNPGPDAGELKSRWIELGRSFARAHLGRSERRPYEAKGK